MTSAVENMDCASSVSAMASAISGLYVILSFQFVITSSYNYLTKFQSLININMYMYIDNYDSLVYRYYNSNVSYVQKKYDCLSFHWFFSTIISWGVMMCLGSSLLWCMHSRLE